MANHIVDQAGKIYGYGFVKAIGRITLKCNGCGIEFSKRPSYKKTYCSISCFNKSRLDPDMPFKSLMDSILIRSKGTAKNAPKQVNITWLDIKGQWEKQKGICPYTGWKLKLKISGRSGSSAEIDQASLDRFDSSKGYIKGNIQFVALMANYAKSNFLEVDLIQFCLAVRGNFSKKGRELC